MGFAFSRASVDRADDRERRQGPHRTHLAGRRHAAGHSKSCVAGSEFKDIAFRFR